MTDSQELMKKVLAAIESRNVSLSESPTRILLMLPTRLRVNVTVKDDNNEPLTATLVLTENGQVTCKLATDRAETVVDISRYRV